ncbi:uncharacterized protein [Battus philenor]|uniref:uncharacterized protein n=1 Tax=Battus philenor TaxID=42288 RepID=UPI0035CF23BD
MGRRVGDGGVVRRECFPAGVSVISYAVNTPVFASGDNFERARELAELGTEVVVAKIRGLGLEIAPNKTETLWFHRLSRTREPPDSRVRVGGHDVTVGRYMKYLRLTLDSRWGFGEHFDRLVTRIERIAGAMHRLLPNFEGPMEEVRRFMQGTKIYSVQQRMEIRIVRGYCTISFEAVTVLACFSHLDVVVAILSVFEAWMQRRDGRLNYRLTQVLIGYGSFGDYLCRIGHEATENCFHCGGAARDSALHTLADYPAWLSERWI